MRAPRVEEVGRLAMLAACAVAVGACSTSNAGTATKGDASPSASARSSVEPPEGSAQLATPAPSQVTAHRPTELRLASGSWLPVDVSATSPDGLLVIPEDVQRAGWWDGSSRLGDPFGAIVVAAHVDSFDQGLGPFAELLTARPGDVVELVAGPLRQEFRIESAELVDKSAVDADADIYRPGGAPRLVLVTCGGPYDAEQGGYQDNLVAIARPVSELGQETG